MGVKTGSRGCRDGEQHPGVRRVVGSTHGCRGSPDRAQCPRAQRVPARVCAWGRGTAGAAARQLRGRGGQKGVQWGARGHSRVLWGAMGLTGVQQGAMGHRRLRWGAAGCDGAQRYLLRVGVGGGGQDVGDEGTVLDVLVVTHHVDGVLARLRGPVPHVTRAVPLVVTLDLGLRWALDGETWGTVAPLGDVVLQETPRVPGTTSPCPCPCPQGDATPYVPVVVTPSPCPCLHCGVPQPVPVSPVWWHLLCAHVPVVVTPRLCPGSCHPMCLRVPRVMSPSLCPCLHHSVPQPDPVSPAWWHPVCTHVPRMVPPNISPCPPLWPAPVCTRVPIFTLPSLCSRPHHGATQPVPVSPQPCPPACPHRSVPHPVPTSPPPCHPIHLHVPTAMPPPNPKPPFPRLVPPIHPTGVIPPLPPVSPLTQGAHFSADGFHHEVCRLAHHSTLQSRSPSSHLLGPPVRVPPAPRRGCGYRVSTGWGGPLAPTAPPPPSPGAW